MKNVSYTEKEIEEIVRRSAKILGIKIDESALKEIASRSRSTPRTANYLIKRCRDFAQIRKSDLTKETVDGALSLLGIDKRGLTLSDRKILETVVEKYGGGPVGLNTIAASLSEDQATIEEFNEPYLIQIGFIERTPRGRIVTPFGYAHLGVDFPEDRHLYIHGDLGPNSFVWLRFLLGMPSPSIDERQGVVSMFSSRNLLCASNA